MDSKFPVGPSIEKLKQHYEDPSCKAVVVLNDGTLIPFPNVCDAFREHQHNPKAIATKFKANRVAVAE